MNLRVVDNPSKFNKNMIENDETAISINKKDNKDTIDSSNNININIIPLNESFNTNDTSKLVSKKISAYLGETSNSKQFLNKSKEVSEITKFTIDYNEESNMTNMTNIIQDKKPDQLEQTEPHQDHLILNDNKFKNQTTNYSNSFGLIQANKKDRYDYFGTKIIKGKKKQKVTFIDKIKKDTKLVDTVYIKSIKEILKNAKYDEEECKCLIF